MIAEDSDNLDIRKQCHNYSNICSKITNQTDLIVVFGGSKAGKSITVDLLAGKQLSLYKDIGLGTDVMVASGNVEQCYPPIYVVDDRGTTLMQCFTLNQQCSDSKIQVLKLIYLQKMIEAAAKVSFIFVFDETMVSNIVLLIQHFLRSMGISSEKMHPNTHILKDYIYFFVTKTEPGLYEQVKQNICELKTTATNQNVTAIIDHIINNNNMAQFQIQNPTSAFQTAIRKQFYPRQNRKQLLLILSNSCLRQQKLLPEVDFTIHEKEVINLFCDIGKVITDLALFSNRKQAKYRKNVENITRQIFSKYNIKVQIDIIVGNWSITQLKLADLEIAQDIKGRTKWNRLSHVLISILCSFQSVSPQSKQGLIYMKESLIFCSKLGDWLPQMSSTNQLQQIIGDINELIRLLRTEQKSTPVIHRPLPKKKPTPFSLFKQELQSNCVSNKDAIIFCIDKIKEKQQAANFQFNEVIFHIKLLRDLMEQFYQQDRTFIYEVLQLSLYSQNFYIFDVYLRDGISHGILDAKYSVKMVKALLNYKRFQECRQIVRYAQGLTPLQEDRRLLSSIKRIINREYQEQFKNMYEGEIKSSQAKKISFTFEAIQQKANSNIRVAQMLSQSTFLRYLTNMNE